MWPFVAPWVQAMQAWTCAMSGWGAGWPPSSCPSGPATQVSFKTSSKYPIEVSACVDPGADAMRLTADPLVGEKKDAPDLRGITIESQCGHVRICVTIPDDQPAGKYTGAIKDATGCKRGELTIQTSGPATARSATE
jgi:hypothetical protein